MPAPGLSPALVLFDLDGTLLRGVGPAHAAALVEAAHRVLGVTTTLTGIDTAGALDEDLLVRMLADAGLDQPGPSLPAIMAEAERLYPEMVPADLRSHVCPGVEPLLQALTEAGAVLGLVSGNLAAIGWTKLARAGLDGRFRLGAFSPQAPTRAGLVSSAVRHAVGCGWVGPHGPVSLVGDHANDVQAARASGVRSVAVATGRLGVEELASHAPDVLVRDLRELSWEGLLQ